MPFGFWYIFQDDIIACEPPQYEHCIVREIRYLFVILQPRLTQTFSPGHFCSCLPSSSRRSTEESHVQLKRERMDSRPKRIFQMLQDRHCRHHHVRNKCIGSVALAHTCRMSYDNHVVGTASTFCVKTCWWPFSVTWKKRLP